MTCTLNTSLPLPSPYVVDISSTSFNPSVYVSWINSNITCANEQISLLQNQITSLKNTKIVGGKAQLLSILNEENTINQQILILQSEITNWQNDISISSIQSRINVITSNLSSNASQSALQLATINNLKKLLNYLTGGQSSPSIPSVESSTIPTSNNQYPITKTVKTESTIPTTSTKISNPVSKAINVIKSKTTSIPNALFNFYSMYRNYLLGLIILAIFVVIIAKGDKKHE